MPQGDKRSYSSKQKRKAAHIEQSYRERGVSAQTAEERAWRTVNKQDGGARGRSTRSAKAKRSPRGPRARKTSTRRPTARKRTARQRSS